MRKLRKVPSETCEGPFYFFLEIQEGQTACFRIHMLKMQYLLREWGVLFACHCMHSIRTHDRYAKQRIIGVAGNLNSETCYTMTN